MNINYNLILVVLLLVSVAVLMLRRWIPKGVVGYARSFFPILLVVVLLRSFVFELFSIPSPSMMPGLIPGDRIYVAKYAYALRLPVLNTALITTGAPQRGDVIVFRLPSDPSTNYIKRLVGLPGDHVTVLNNRLFINGKAMPLQTMASSLLATETFDGVPHTLMFLRRPGTDFDAVVPAGHYFFMGDNRNDSQDSRFPVVGFVPERNIVGQARRILFSWRLPHWPMWTRSFRKIS